MLRCTINVGPQPGLDKRHRDFAEAFGITDAAGQDGVSALEALRARIARDSGAYVPGFDPRDGGADARLLLLLETPGPRTRPGDLVTRDKATPTGANLRRFLGESGIARADTVMWNAVPWVIHAEGARNRAPRAAELRLGLSFLPELLAALPRLRVAVLAGRAAGFAEPVLCAAGVPVLRMPHPSPTIVCTSPAVPARIRAALGEAKALLEEEGA